MYDFSILITDLDSFQIVAVFTFKKFILEESRKSKKVELKLFGQFFAILSVSK